MGVFTINGFEYYDCSFGYAPIDNGPEIYLKDANGNFIEIVKIED